MSWSDQSIERLAREWVVGREVELLKRRVESAVETFEDSDSYDPELRSDYEAYAEELQAYASSAMESIPVSVLAQLLEEFLV